MKNLMANATAPRSSLKVSTRCSFSATALDTTEQFQAPAPFRFPATRQRSPLWFLIEMRLRLRQNNQRQRNVHALSMELNAA